MTIIIEVILCLHVLEVKNCTLSSPNYFVPYHHLIQLLLQTKTSLTVTKMGMLKMRDMKQRERKRRHQMSQKAGVETVRNGNCGTLLQGVENARMNIRERQSIESRWLLNTGKHGQQM